MPTFDFRCTRCLAVFEARRDFGAANPPCLRCGSAVEPVFLTPLPVFGQAAAGRDTAARSLPECGKGCRCCP